MTGDYPPKDPKLPEIPGVKLTCDESEIYAWQAWRFNALIGWETIARAPWKKLCWKQAKKFMEQMG
jgi:hypothetical protein